MSDTTHHETAERRISRAAAVRFGAVAAAGAAAAALAAPDAASANGALTTGTTNTETASTDLNNTGTGYGLRVSAISGTGLVGLSGGGSGEQGVEGFNTNGNGNGVYGQSGSDGSLIFTPANGVHGVCNTDGENGVLGEHRGSGDGVRGTSSGGNGVEGTSATGNGVAGSITSSVTDTVAAMRASNGGTGVGLYAESNGGACIEAKDRSVSTDAYGVYAQSSGGTAVYGDSTDGIGVFANTYDGTAFTARGQFGVAIDVQGTAKFSSSGIKAITGTVATPKSTVRVTGVALTSSSIVLATIQSNNAPGVFVQSAVPNVAGSYFTLTLNKSVSKTVKIGWFVVN
jgi:hypothetical protein